MAKGKKDITTGEKLSSFPSETLTDCRDIVSQMVKRKGETTIPFKEIAIILGKPAPNITLPISTCTQYGLLENIHGSGYRPTELFNRIEMPVFPSQREAAIIEALSNAPLYTALIDEFNGRILPDAEGMANYLIKNFGVKSYLIIKVVKVFFKNFSEHGLIDSNNRLRVLSPVITAQPKNSENVKQDKVEVDTVKPVEIASKNSSAMFEQAIDLGGSETDVAYLKYPRSIKEEQVALLRIHLEASLKALEARFKRVANTIEEKKEQ